jgi:hypothetical protein
MLPTSGKVYLDANRFITNDPEFRRVPGLAVVVLSDLDLPAA